MIIKCKMCGGDLRPTENATTCECEYCGSIQTIPKLDNERRLNLYDRANHFRRNNEYDKAMGIFEQILQDDRTDAEAYWSLVLCRYGIEYVEDPATKKRIPTVNRTQFTSILADEDYKSALEYADAKQKGIYEEEAKTIDTIQKGILDISKKEKPFDVFICYKETDAQGKRTPDSVLANDLYHQLTQEGFKVFFSRITLEDKLGQQYEPYIFAALNSAKVMVVLGTKPEYFNAAWVKNEWSRYLALIRTGANKTLVPAYKDMDPYDLPEEFSHLQAQDMSKLGFMQDLIRGIKKLTSEEKPTSAPQPVIVQNTIGADGSNVNALLDRAFMSLEDGEWAKADDFCEKVLNIDARNARAYVGKLMAELKVRKEANLQNMETPLEQSKNFSKAVRFADSKLAETLNGYNDTIKGRIEQNHFKNMYQEAMRMLGNARTVQDVNAVKNKLALIYGYKEVAEGLKQCEQKTEAINAKKYDSANTLMSQQRYAQAAMLFHALGDYRDSKTVAVKCDALEREKQARLAEEQAEQNRIQAERRAKEEAEQKEKERIQAELLARQAEIKRRRAAALAEKIKKAIIIAAIIVALSVAAFFVVTKVVVPKANYDKALAMLKNGEYSNAIEIFTELGDYEDSRYRIIEAQANIAFDNKDYITVGNLYAYLPEAYQEHASYFSSLYSQALDLRNSGNYNAAVSMLEKIGNYKDSEEQINETFYLKAAALEESGDLVGAAEVYKKVGEYKDSHERRFYLLAQIQADTLYDSSDYAAAWEIYSPLPEKYQTHSADYATMYAAATTLLENGSYDDAAAQFVVLGNYSDSADMISECSYQKAASLAADGMKDAAVALYNMLGDYKDSAALSAQASADKLFASGAYADAYDVYVTLDAAYQMHKADYEAMYASAKAQLEAGDYDEAHSLFASLGRYSDSTVMVLECDYRKAGSLAANGDYDTAITLYNTLGKYRDSSILAVQAKADRLYDAGAYADAYDIYAKLDAAYQTHGADYAAMYAAAEQALASGDYDNAYDKFVALGSYGDAAAKAAQCGKDKANALFAAEKYDEAAEVFAFIGDAENADLSTYRYAKQLAEQGEYKQAANAYFTIMDYEDSREQHYQMGLQARANGQLADAYTILSEDAEYRDAKEGIYQTGVAASKEALYEVSVPCFTLVGAYKDSAMKLTMDTYAWGGQLYDNGDYDKSAEIFASMGDFSDAPTRADEAAYAAAKESLNNGTYDDAAKRFEALNDYSDSAEEALYARYLAANEQLENGNFADAKARFTKLGNYGDSANKALECDYRPAMNLFNAGDYKNAKTAFLALGNYSNSAAMAKECDYIPAKALYDAKAYTDALSAWTANGLNGYKDSDTLMSDCRYHLAQSAMAEGDYETAASLFDEAGEYGDSKAQAAECRRLIALKKGAAYEANGDYENAYAQYTLANETGKMSETAYSAALTKLTDGDYPAAIEWFEKAGKNYSDVSEQILTIGEYYYATQQYDEAEAVYVKVVNTGVAAQRLYELGQYYELVGDTERAAKAYGEAGSYPNAPDKAKEMQYQIAEALYDKGDYENAKSAYAKISGYKDVDSKIASCENEIAAAAAAKAALEAKWSVGNYVDFGTYPQTKAGTDKTAIEWLVLDRDGNKALIISRYGLDAQPYNSSYTSITWEKCTLRTWLNSTFLNKAFTSEEQKGIVLTNVDNSKSQGYWSTNGGNNTQDTIFLLSYAEANKYFGVTYNGSNNTKARVEPTAYALAQGAWTSSSNKTASGKAAGYWWLRSPGGSRGNAASVSTDGSLSNSSVDSVYDCVRPALWVNLDSDIFQSGI